MPAKLDIIGVRFGRLKVIGEASPYRVPSSGKFSRKAICECDCGVILEVHNSHLRAGITTSCGCFRRDRPKYLPLIHGHARIGKHTRIYRVWGHMLKRCEDTRVPEYKNYGGRGISVCKRWHMFANFLADMGEPGFGLTLNRINNDGNYEPGNCNWITIQEQLRNKRNTRYVVFQGERMPLIEACERIGLPYRRVYNRLKDGWSEEKALSHA